MVIIIIHIEIENNELDLDDWTLYTLILTFVDDDDDSIHSSIHQSIIRIGYSETIEMKKK